MMATMLDVGAGCWCDKRQDWRTAVKDGCYNQPPRVGTTTAFLYLRRRGERAMSRCSFLYLYLFLWRPEDQNFPSSENDQPPAGLSWLSFMATAGEAYQTITSRCDPFGQGQHGPDSISATGDRVHVRVRRWWSAGVWHCGLVSYLGPSRLEDKRRGRQSYPKSCHHSKPVFISLTHSSSRQDGEGV